MAFCIKFKHRQVLYPFALPKPQNPTGYFHSHLPTSQPASVTEDDTDLLSETQKMNAGNVKKDLIPYYYTHHSFLFF